MRNIISTFLMFLVLMFAISAEGTTENLLTSTGTVKFYNEDKGFGYIIDKETGDELFVYDDGLIDEIYDGDEVKYIIRDTRKGLESINVRLK